jgi:hypothetical protein
VSMLTPGSINQSDEGVEDLFRRRTACIFLITELVLRRGFRLDETRS